MQRTPAFLMARLLDPSCRVSPRPRSTPGRSRRCSLSPQAASSPAASDVVAADVAARAVAITARGGQEHEERRIGA